jgi:hypothetical protein
MRRITSRVRARIPRIVLHQRELPTRLQRAVDQAQRPFSLRRWNVMEHAIGVAEVELVFGVEVAHQGEAHARTTVRARRVRDRVRRGVEAEHLGLRELPRQVGRRAAGAAAEIQDALRRPREPRLQVLHAAGEKECAALPRQAEALLEHRSVFVAAVEEIRHCRTIATSRSSPERRSTNA